MKRLKIGVDIDGVLSNFIGKYREICMEITGRDLPHESLDWHQTNWGMTKEEHEKAWEVIGKTFNFYLELEPLDSASPRSLDILNCNHTLYFITTRPSTKGFTIEEQSAMWIDENFTINYPTVIVAKDKGPIAKALELDYFIDDAPANVLSVYEHSPKTKVFLNDQSWNRDFTEGDIQRVKNFNEFVDIINGE